MTTTITGDQLGTPPRLAIPDFLALPAIGSSSTDAETVNAATTIAQVLRDDIGFERDDNKAEQEKQNRRGKQIVCDQIEVHDGTWRLKGGRTTFLA